MSYNYNRHTSSRNRTSSYRRSNNGFNAQRKPRKQDIHYSRFIKPAIPPAETPAFVPQHNFTDFALHPILQNNLSARGFVSPSPIQDQAIPAGLAGQDIIGIANTGTGKTAAFALPLLNRLLDRSSSAKALIIAPTRELAQQIASECQAFAKGTNLHSVLLIGGTPMYSQIRNLKNQPSLIIGTPGRIKDHTQRGTLNLANCNIVVLDEVDRMVDMGFIADIRLLLSKLATRRQSYFFSATLDTKLEQLVNSFLNEPITISVKTSETSDSVEQNVVHYSSPTEKLDKLHNTLINGDNKTLIFDETQRGVERLSKELQARGFKADAIHGGKTQGQRQRALNRFLNNEIKVLVATDVAARGIDIVDITHVINYTTPQSYDDYIHRIGRAGRAGRAGQALTFVGN